MLIGAACQAVNAIAVGMEGIEAEFVAANQPDYYTDAACQSETGDADERKDRIAAQVAPGYFQVVKQHLALKLI